MNITTMNWYQIYMSKLAQVDENQGVFDFFEEEEIQQEKPEVLPKRKTSIELVNTDNNGNVTFMVDGAKYTFNSPRYKFVETVEYLAKGKRGGSKIAFNWAKKNYSTGWVVDVDGAYRDLEKGDKNAEAI